MFIATSLDGFIAGPGDDLSWLPEGGGEDHGYNEFMAATAAILIGRITYDVVLGFDGWPYGDTPVFVATSRPLDPVVPGVRAVGGEPEQILAAVRAVTDGNIYLDGGVLIRQFMAAGLIERADRDHRPRDPGSRFAALRRPGRAAAPDARRLPVVPERARVAGVCAGGMSDIS